MTQRKNKRLHTSEVTSKLREIRETLVAELKVDYVGLWSFLWKLTRAFPEASNQEIRSMTIQLIREVMVEECAWAGMPKSDGSFQRWETNVEESIELIQQEWDELGREPNIGDIVWLMIP